MFLFCQFSLPMVKSLFWWTVADLR
uniref:Uncharacterized protein n=1 Tax=Arundo donax TaxID=35708 RepID=A0A0A9H3B3_ARUDO